MTERPKKGETSSPSEYGILYNRIPEAGVIVPEYNISELLKHPNIIPVDLSDRERETGVSQVLIYSPNKNSKCGWDYMEEIIFDSRNRPVETFKREGGIDSWQSFQYDGLGRLVKIHEEINPFSCYSIKYTYTSDEPNESGKYPFTVEKTDRNGRVPVQKKLA
jgi:hypothetical protein